jgi:hypothetical protein
MDVRRCRAAGAALAALLVTAGCEAPAPAGKSTASAGAPLPPGVEVFRGKVLNEDCAQFGYARTIVFRDFTSGCSPDGGNTAGPVIHATAWFNCRLPDQDVWARGERWSQCLNGVPHENGDGAYLVTAFGCMGPAGIGTAPCLMSQLPPASLEVAGDSPEALLLRALNLRLSDVLGQVMAEGGPSLEDRLLLIKTADLFAELADAGFADGSPLTSVGAVDAAHRLLDLATDFTPGVSLLKDATIVVTGRNPVTGETVSDFERALTLGAMVVPSFLTGAAKGVIKTAHNLERVAESQRPLRNLASELVGSLERAEVDMAELVADLPCPSAAIRSEGRLPLAAAGVDALSVLEAQTPAPGFVLPTEGRPAITVEAPCIRSLGTITAEVVARSKVNLDALKRGEVGFGEAPRLDYSKTYRQHYATYNDQIGQVHHAVEQVVLQRYPGVVTESEMHSLRNLRGIPVGGTGMHQSQLRAVWDTFYQRFDALGRPPRKDELLTFAREVDDKFGSLFVPPIR